MNHTITRLVAAASVALLLAVVAAPAAQAQYIEELPSTTAIDVGSGGEDRGSGVGGTGADDGIVATGSDLAWLLRLGAAALVVGGLVMLSPARRNRAHDLAAARRVGQHGPS
jgi:hypothetical protein